MEVPTNTRNILGTILMIAGLAVMVWSVAGEVSAPESAETAAESSALNDGWGSDQNEVSTEPATVAATETAEPPSATQESIEREMAKVWPAGLLPAVLSEGRPEIKAAYMFASSQENYQVLEAQTCYCGCEATGAHGNLRDCFIKEALPGDKVIYESHGQYCGICVGEALDTESWMKEGKNPDQIKVLMDSKYSRH